MIEYLNRANMDYIETLFQQYLQNPQTIPSDWRYFFNGLQMGQKKSIQSISGSFSQKELAVFQLIVAYREDGHLQATLDPLKGSFMSPPGSLKSSKLLESFGLSSKDWDQKFQMSSLIGLPAWESLGNIVQTLEKIYCGSISLQVGGSPPDIREWFFNEFEKTQRKELSSQQKKDIFYDLARAEALERFLHSRFVGSKRFSIEGGDVLIPMLSYLAQWEGWNTTHTNQTTSNQTTQANVNTELVIGMSHRGRLNVLCNFLNQAVDILFMEFDGGKAFKNFDFEGDVKYHAGYSSVKKFSNGHSCNILLAYNPSHLEAVNSVVCGVTRARQRIHNDHLARQKVMAVLIHGDAAVCGQGCVSETLQLSNLSGYKTGGSLHIVLNNQVGFTTDPKDARSSVHASDLAKVIQAPVLLVNADDVLSCIRAMDLAIRFRQKFGRDVFIELVCYRRYGHNESDEPAFTQPIMSQTIKKHPRVRDIYSNQLANENILSAELAQKFYEQQFQKYQTVLDQTRHSQSVQKLSQKSLKGSLWSHSKKIKEEDFFVPVDTCPLDKDLQKTWSVLTTMPRDFNCHPKIKKLIENRQKMIQNDALDWALCELSAYGTLCLENHPVRISGQDSIRGTFSHRHSMYFDTQTGKSYCPLATLNPVKGEFCVYNSPLSEMAVLGFEYGNACADSSFFTLWEAQFGDFSNGAQIIIDQFISSGEEKWMQSCNLVLLLPHGYEGQGPEHSSARLERYLQLCAQNNMQVCYPTTPANFFHLLRRQMKRNFRKPLIVMTPKSLLRHPEVVSSKRDLIRSNGFQEVLPDSGIKKTKEVEVLILCSGKVYFDLNKERQKSLATWKHVALVRVEQLYPFPTVPLTPWLNGYPRLKKVLWVQEEPVNMGAMFYIIPRLEKLMHQLGRENLPLIALSRPEKASPATGSFQVHQQELDHLMNCVVENI